MSRVTKLVMMKSDVLMTPNRSRRASLTGLTGETEELPYDRKQGSNRYTMELPGGKPI